MQRCLCPGSLGPQDGTTERTAILAPLADREGKPVQPFFTSEDGLNETISAVPGYESRYLALTCRQLWELTRGSTLVLSPNSMHGKKFLPGEIGQLVDGSAAMSTHVVAAETRVLVGRPAIIPPGMEEALTGIFSNSREVESAFLGWKVTSESGDQSYLLVVVGSSQCRPNVSDELGRALVYFSLSHPVDVMYAQPGEAHLLTSIKPFYIKRERRRLQFWRRH